MTAYEKIEVLFQHLHENRVSGIIARRNASTSYRSKYFTQSLIAESQQEFENYFARISKHPMKIEHIQISGRFAEVVATKFGSEGKATRIYYLQNMDDGWRIAESRHESFEGD